MPIIAVIDDRATNRTILAKLATGLGDGIVVRAFADPREALDWAAETTPDLIITDYKMPTMDGAEFIQAFRSMPMCYDVPVIVVTVYEDRAFRYRALDAGATDFLISPFDHREFRARIHNLLVMRRQQEIIRRRAFSLEERLLLTNRLREEETRQSRERLKCIIDTVPAMICVTDSGGQCILANSCFCSFFELAEDQIIGRSLWQWIGSNRATNHKAYDEQVFARGEPCEFEEDHTDHDGTRRTFLTVKVPLRDSSDGVGTVVTVSTDITERKEAEALLVRAKEAAEAASLTKTQFLANTSHELRTPLNAIIGFAEILEGEFHGPIGNSKYRQYVSDILVSAQHLLNLINDILDVSRIESGRVELSEGKIDLKRSVSAVLRLVQPRVDEAQVQLKAAIPDGLMLFADERKLKQIVLNVVSNAVKFTPPGGVVSVAAERDGDGSTEIRVMDTGIGIPEKDIPTAMARFGRVRTPPGFAQSGTGLGLPLAIDLMRLHGGTLDIASAIGHGTTVTIKFPRERSIDQ